MKTNISYIKAIVKVLMHCNGEIYVSQCVVIVPVRWYLYSKKT